MGDEKKQVCATHYEEVCKPSYNYGKTCEKVPKESCHYATEKKCTKVPHESCHDYTVPHCKNVPQQHCTKEYKQKCHDVPVQVPVKKEKAICVWPSYRQHHDDTGASALCTSSDINLNLQLFILPIYCCSTTYHYYAKKLVLQDIMLKHNAA